MLRMMMDLFLHIQSTSFLLSHQECNKEWIISLKNGIGETGYPYTKD